MAPALPWSGVSLVVDPAEAARAAGLRYVVDAMPGIRRRKAGKRFAYLDPDGRPVEDEETLARIKALAIPPAWTDVWICPSPRGHVQATGRDARGRKQYRYHPRWRETRDEVKYGKMLAFGEALPAIRAKVDEQLRQRTLSRELVLAAVVRLLDLSYIRIGNEEYARTNKSFGLTTMRDRHATVEGGEIRLRFRGKAGKVHSYDLRDLRLARIVKRCQELPGQDLFQFLDESGTPQAIGSADVNDYLRRISGQDFTAKDFRTWAGTVLAVETLAACEPCETQTDVKHNVVETIKTVAEQLGNTPSICRKCYVHPAVLESYMDGKPAEIDAEAEGADGLRPAERAVLRLLSAQQNEGGPPERGQVGQEKRVVGQAVRQRRDHRAGRAERQRTVDALSA
jgi:DNA topoisomerase-1